MQADKTGDARRPFVCVPVQAAVRLAPDFAMRRELGELCWAG
jgi:hypothetical protein